jgi:excisionase family DNA binding protein
MPDEFLTVAEVAEILKLNQQTVRNWITDGKLPAVRVGQRRVRIRRADFERLLARAPAPRPSPPRASGMERSRCPSCRKGDSLPLVAQSGRRLLARNAARARPSLNVVETLESAHSVVDIRPRWRPTAEVRSRAAEPAIDCLESQVREPDWEFCNDILVAFLVKLPFAFGPSI